MALGAEGVRCNQVKMRRLTLCCLLFLPLLLAATKERNWKAGKVAADSSISSSEYTSGDAKPHQSANDPHILIIQGDDKIYTAEERHAWNGWCLLIQGEEIKYSEDSRRLYVVDADGYKCKLDILKQESRSSP